MSNRILQLIISAKDQASGTFGKVAGAINNLGRAARGTQGSMAGAATGTQGLAGSITKGILQANLLGQALNAVGNAAASMGAKFEEAKKIELQLVSSAGTFSALTGKNFKDSTKFVNDFNSEISKVAAAMPGATSDYNQVANSILDNVIPAFKDASGVVNDGALKKGLVDITKKMTLLGIQSGTDAGAVGMFTARLLGGDIGSARNLMFAENNPAFMGILEDALKKQGKTTEDFKAMTEKQRLELITAVSGKLITDDVINAASNTVDGLIAGIQSMWFDPQSGVFGLLRDLSSADGQQTVMSAVGEGIKAVSKFFSVGSKILSALGIPSVDPMLALYNGLRTVTRWIDGAANIMNRVAGGLKGNPSQNLGKLFNQFGAMWGNIDFESLGTQVGSFVATLIVKTGQALASVNWGAVLSTIGRAYLGLLSAQAKFWSGYFRGYSGILFGAIANATLSMISGIGASILSQVSGAGTAIMTGLGIVLNVLKGAFTSYLNYMAGTIPGRIAQGVLAVTGTLLSVAGQVLSVTGAVLSGYFNIWSGRFINFVSQVGNAITSGLRFAYNATVTPLIGIIQSWSNTTLGIIRGIFNAGVSAVNVVATPIINGFTQFANAFQQGVMGVINQIMSIIQGLVSKVQGFVSGAQSMIGGFNPVPAIQGGILRAGANLTQSINTFIPRYNGQIPTAANGWLGAFAQESARMPAGASPVVANSSEFILTPAQMSRMMQGAASVGAASGSGGSRPPINANFYISGTSDPASLAQQVLRELDSLLNREMGSQLA